VRKPHLANVENYSSGVAVLETQTDFNFGHVD
jgi:hypothetical protein